jgi:hypothetical protein
MSAGSGLERPAFQATNEALLEALKSSFLRDLECPAFHATADGQPDRWLERRAFQRRVRRSGFGDEELPR